MHVLIVDDVEMARRNIRIALEKESIDSIEAATGKQAVEILKGRNDIDIITLDIDLPDMNGMEVLRQIREFNKDVIVIIISGMIDRETEMLGTRLGVYNFVTKPVDVEKLTKYIKKIRERI